jgi:hypothetical protein
MRGDKMNIQFMTVEKNGIPTGEKDWKENPRYRYMPDFEEMIANACCEEEAEAIRETENLLKKWDAAFNFEIVYMVYKPAWDPNKGHTETKWQMYQHPWYRDQNGVYDSKEQMIELIETELKEA